MTKLTQEQKEDLTDLADSGAWSAVLALIDIGIEKQRHRVLNTNIDKSDRDIVLAKAKLDGAREIQALLFNIREQISTTKKR